MAKFIPTGWKMPQEGQQLFMKVIGRVEGIVRKRVKKYSLSGGTDPDDLMQEGRLAAAYAVSTFKQERGNLEGYIASVVENALAMVAAEQLAQRRQPYVYQRQGETWERVPAVPSQVDPERVVSPETTELTMIGKHEALAGAVHRHRARKAINALPMCDDARTLLQLRLRPPAELMITARNLSGGRHRIDCAALSHYLSWPKPRVRRAMREVECTLSEKMGIQIGQRPPQRVKAAVL